MSLRSAQVRVNSPREQILVLGIDPGTTSFKAAALEAGQVSDDHGNIHIDKHPDQQIIPLSHFPGFERIDSNTVPTALIYNEKSELVKWGHHAINYQTDDRFDPEFLVAYWKLSLRTSSSPAARHLRRNLEATAERLGTTPEKFIEDFFGAVRNFLLDNENSPLLEHLGGAQALQEFKYIDVVIALPPGWPRQEHRDFTSAATQGLGDNGKLRIFTVSETECVLNQWITEPRNRKKVKAGDIVMLLDLGGGTACISLFRCIAAPPASEKFRWEHIESHSLTAGSQIVTEGFITDFQRRAKEAGVPLTAQLIHRARKEFDERKLSIGEEKPERDWSIDVEGLKRVDTRGLGNGKMWFTGEKLLGYFKTSQDQILEKVNEVMGRVARGYLMSTFCVVAGAYGNNVIFKQQLKALNKTKNYGMDINFPNYCGEAVVRGACLARVEGEFSQSSGSRYSVAVLIYMPWREAAKHFPSAAVRTFDGDNTLYSPVLEWKIKKGDPVMANHTIAADSDRPRQRLFSREEEIIFDDTIYTSEYHPGEGRYTYLKYKTSNPVDWKSYEIDLLERGIEVKAFEVTWDLRKVFVLQKDGSYRPMPREALPINRAKKMPYLNYKYHIKVGQIDIKLYIESFFTKRRTDMMAMSHKQIVVKDQPESTTLVQEYEHLPDFTESSNREDEPCPAENVAEGDILSLEKHQHEYPEDPAATTRGYSSDYDNVQWLETDATNSKRQKRTHRAPYRATNQSTSMHMLRDVGFTSINQGGIKPLPPTNEEPQEGVAGPETATVSRRLLINEPSYGMQDSASRTYSPQANPPPNYPMPHILQPLGTSSPNSLRRPTQETLAALRIPVVESRKRDLWDVVGSRRNSRHTIDPFK